VKEPPGFCVYSDVTTETNYGERESVDNNIHGHYVEPYAGGASVALYLLLEGKVDRITINDYDRSIYAFWYSVLNRTKKLCDLIEKTDVNIENWLRMREIQKRKKDADILELGFSTLFLNRTNRSGILDAGVIGGLKQEGSYGMDCRFNKEEIIKRIRLIAKYKKRISLYNEDALELIKRVQVESNNSDTIFYFDPPYYLKGPRLYKNSYNNEDHDKVSQEIKKNETPRGKPRGISRLILPGLTLDPVPLRKTYPRQAAGY